MDLHRATKALHRALSIEPTGERVHGPCDCCDHATRTVWGFAHRQSGDTLASYFVSWTVGSPQHDVYVDLIIGRWGDNASPADRKAVSLAYRAAKGGFMVIDAGKRPLASSPLVSAALAPAQVVDLPMSTLAYAIVDAIWLDEARIVEVLGWSSPIRRLTRRYMNSRTFWSVTYWMLLAAFLGAAVLGMLRVRAGFVTNHLADVTVPAWLYVVARGLGPGIHTGNRLTRTVGRSPEWCGFLLFTASALTEVSQRYWPHGLFPGRFDPYDVLAYGVGVGACYVAERWLPRPTGADGPTSPVA